VHIDASDACAGAEHIALLPFECDRFEGRIVQQLIRNDGGEGEYTESTPAVLGIWDTLLQVMLACLLHRTWHCLRSVKLEEVFRRTCV
jgi:hypothetical protein